MAHREFLTEIDPKLEPNLVQTLHMINSDYVNNHVRYGGTLSYVRDKTKTAEEGITALYARTLCRPPSPVEMSKAKVILQSVKDREQAIGDLLWALVTSREFYFNH